MRVNGRHLLWLLVQVITNQSIQRAMRAGAGATRGATTGVPPSSAGDRRRVGSRFWALADSDEDDVDEDGDGSPAASPSPPTPSDLICEFFHSGYDEDEVARTVN